MSVATECYRISQDEGVAFGPGHPAYIQELQLPVNLAAALDRGKISTTNGKRCVTACCWYTPTEQTLFFLDHTFSLFLQTFTVEDSNIDSRDY